MQDSSGRKSIRLPYFDYGSEAYYFITVCARDRACVFGSIRNGKFAPSALGRLVDWHWQIMAQHRSYVKLDEYVVMPNHFHGLLQISERQLPRKYHVTDVRFIEREFGPLRRATLSSILGVFKSFVTRAARADGNWDAKPMWQERFHDHIVRDAEALAGIRQYIRENPIHWQNDRWNGDCDGPDEFETWLDEQGQRPLVWRAEEGRG